MHYVCTCICTYVFVHMQIVVLLGHRHELLHGNRQAEGCQEAVVLVTAGKVPAAKRQVPPPAHSLPNVWLVSHGASKSLPISHHQVCRVSSKHHAYFTKAYAKYPLEVKFPFRPRLTKGLSPGPVQQRDPHGR